MTRPREEFPKAEKRKMAQRSGGRCERSRWRPTQVCTKPAKEFHHLQADGLGGKPVAENGAHMCPKCHQEADNENNAIMRKADAQRDAAAGVKRKSIPIKSRGFAKTEKAEKRAAGDKLPLPRRTQDIYGRPL